MCQVVQTLTLGLNVSQENNRFALFELCGRQVKVVDDRTILADVLGKFERYARNYDIIQRGYIIIYFSVSN